VLLFWFCVKGKNREYLKNIGKQSQKRFIEKELNQPKLGVVR
jgi:hypothetical protein